MKKTAIIVLIVLIVALLVGLYLFKASPEKQVEATAAPSATEAPAATEVPASTEVSSATEEPSATDVPATEAPEATAAPEAAPAPTRAVQLTSLQEQTERINQMLATDAPDTTTEPVESKSETTRHAHDDLASFPANVREKVPEEFTVVNEIISATLDGDPEKVQSMTVDFTFETQYPAGEQVYVLFGFKQKGKTAWIGCKGTANENGSIRVTLKKEYLQRLVGKQFAVAVVSKQ